MSKYKCSDDDLTGALNIARSRKYFTKHSMGGDIFSSLHLTEEGQARAISKKLGRDRSYELNEKSIATTINFNGDIHGGNNMFGSQNAQNIQNYIQELTKRIDVSKATDEEKKEAKSVIFKALDNPLVNTILGIGGSALLQRILGL